MIEFHADDIITHVPTCCLIEDYWILHTAMDALDRFDINSAKETISSVMDCLMESIDRFTQVKSGLQIEPSVSSAIAMSCESGIIMNDKEDLKCLAGNPLSRAGLYYCDACPHHGTCDPDNGEFLLERGIPYKAWGHTDEEDFVSGLQECMQSAEGESGECCQSDGEPVAGRCTEAAESVG